jgi:hypothetical protein
MTSVHGIHAHTRPPESVRLLFKRLQKSRLEDIESDDSILSLPIGLELEHDGMRLVKELETHDLQRSFHDFLQCSQEESGLLPLTSNANAALYEIEALPGQLDISQQLPSPL